MTELSGEPFDLLVIGGGITGCGVARDAAMRGLRVALVERDDFASGTSGRSSRLIHGGIRYLENAQLHLVHEAIRERQTLLRIAPHLVKPLAFTWPLYRGARVGKLKLAAGLFVYDLMAAGRSRRHFALDAAGTLQREPSLRPEGLEGGAVYYDAATDDTRLTLANALAAREHGAVVVNHATVTSILRHQDRATGAIVARNGATEDVRARVILNATGVWENNFTTEERARRLRGSKGVHISVARERIGNREALTLISPLDGRVMFCLPAGSQTIIGTTDTWTSESPDAVRADRSDVDYLLGSINHYFPRAGLTRADVASAWAGIRPLASGGAKSPGRISREHSIVVDDSGIVEVTGGKLTTYRSMAAEIVDLVQSRLGRERRPSTTDSVALPGAGREAAIAQLGRENAELAKPLVPGLGYTGAHLTYGVTNEMALTLSDLLIRRTHIAFETRDHGRAIAPVAADLVAPLLRWTPDEKSAQLRAYAAEVERMFSIAGDY
ncbi:MAG TPA: glycerol-3-phosphate dehydrogenase/oxidase [Gemmatimonadaceae bacterium]|nr:glycerol-3-phosphate dehydrogenase/oxidase [Gemmatimonadaceae bacterium]